MFTVTDAAIEVLKKHLLQHYIRSPIRITLMGGGCKGDSLHFKLSELRKDDLIFSFDRVVFVIDRHLSVQCGPITVDFIEEYEQCPCSGRSGGFSISSRYFPQHCGSRDCWKTCRLLYKEEQERLSRILTQPLLSGWGNSDRITTCCTVCGTKLHL